MFTMVFVVPDIAENTMSFFTIMYKIYNNFYSLRHSNRRVSKLHYFHRFQDCQFLLLDIIFAQYKKYLWMLQTLLDLHMIRIYAASCHFLLQPSALQKPKKLYFISTVFTDSLIISSPSMSTSSCIVKAGISFKTQS